MIKCKINHKFKRKESNLENQMIAYNKMKNKLSILKIEIDLD